MLSLFLASQSPRRRELVKLLGVKHVEVHPMNVNEEVTGLTPEETVLHLSEKKAKALGDHLSLNKNGVILAADTIVTLDNEILNKPKDEQDAERMLSRLSGATHTVYTGVTLIDTATRATDTFAVATKVTFRKLEPEEIKSYIATGSPMDKAGAYGIQEDFGAVFVSKIEGDYYNVVGLPLYEVYLHLKALKPELLKR